MGTQIIKNLVFCLIIVPVSLGAQDDYYPPESFYGGGVGFSQMFLFQNLGQLQSFEMLGSVGDTAGFGFDLTKFANPFIINGGEGFSNITERIRIGGYAGVGTSFITVKPDITLVLDENGDGIYDIKEVFEKPPDLQGKISMWLSGATIEYLFPLFRGLEVSIGSFFGIGRLNLNLSQSAGSPSWKNQFNPVFQIGENGYVLIKDANADGAIDSTDIDYVQQNQFPTIAINSTMTSPSGTFFNVQPYIAVKLQLLDRMGLRMTVGFNAGTINEGEWRTEDRKPILDSPETVLNSMAIRTMIYFGL
ncbi:MAG TPA: hypothetical protein EYN68_06315 [Candidatus Marinimicrobia bacterium]|jgi:hypothetical protein|nr:hypothetical protein [Candidatus Neomarinimicrobiota bacterium]HHZ99150.1 hypothetical protein [Candidatus Neomarinimicrobiota bacterium]HIB04001.1 hypothetical protein [Candidatus Neomarinimicrobiota bacterium]HIB71246.1 hypothetical protein [Candidatus Neomarinimicrobiota bacterium]HIB96016.1 hypothetical protein [Candidatus Neomarinimicrobiota bacterium]